MGGGSYVDITNANIVVQLFTYLFRPLFFDAVNIVQIIASFENLIYLFLFTILLSPKFIYYVIRGNTILLRFCLLYFALGSLVLAMSTPNLGTAVRQKNMVMIAFVVILSMYLRHLACKNRRKEKRLHLSTVTYS
jgi:hypothetical protein